jgi:hypothetical protein
MKRYETAIILATAYLLLYVVIFQLDAPLWLLFLLFMLSPIPVIWMAYQILRNAFYNGPLLGKDDEFGYQDVDKNKLGLF